MTDSLSSISSFCSQLPTEAQLLAASEHSHADFRAKRYGLQDSPARTRAALSIKAQLQELFEEQVPENLLVAPFFYYPVVLRVPGETLEVETDLRLAILEPIGFLPTYRPLLPPRSPALWEHMCSGPLHIPFLHLYPLRAQEFVSIQDPISFAKHQAERWASLYIQGLTDLPNHNTWATYTETRITPKTTNKRTA